MTQRVVEQLTNAILHLKVCDGKGNVALPDGKSVCADCVKSAAALASALSKAVMVVEFASRSQVKNAGS